MISKIRRGFKKGNFMLNDKMYKFGFKHLPKYSSGRRILIYHGITKKAGTNINARFISSSLFEQQISYFKENFNIVTLFEYLSGASQPNKLTVTLTFDDGYLNNLTEALPILEKYKVPATFYITAAGKANYTILWADALDLFRLTGPSSFSFHGVKYRRGKHEYKTGKMTLKNYLKHSDKAAKKELTDIILADNNFLENTEYFPYFKLMNEKQIRQLSESEYAEIGSHGLFHNCLNRVSPEDLIYELKESKAYLESLTQKEVISLAYPDGAYTREIVDIAEQIGYKNQMALEYLFEEDKTDNRIENRFGINPYISFNNQIQCIINGKY